MGQAVPGYNNPSIDLTKSIFPKRKFSLNHTFFFLCDAIISTRDFKPDPVSYFYPDPVAHGTQGVSVEVYEMGHPFKNTLCHPHKASLLCHMPPYEVGEHLKYVKTWGCHVQIINIHNKAKRLQLAK